MEQYDAPPLQSAGRDYEVKTTARKKYFYWWAEHRSASCRMESDRRVSLCRSSDYCGKRPPPVRIGREPYLKSCWIKNVWFGRCCVTLSEIKMKSGHRAGRQARSTPVPAPGKAGRLGGSIGRLGVVV